MRSSGERRAQETRAPTRALQSPLSSRGLLDRRLSRLDYRIGAARGSLETAYALGLNESHKAAAWSHLAALLEERGRLRLRWASLAGDLDRDRIVAGEGFALLGHDSEEIPVYDPEDLVW